MSIRFPDFSVLFHRSVDRHGPEQRGGVVATPEHAHAQAAAIAQENERRRTVIERGQEADRAVLRRQRERERRGRSGASGTGKSSNEKGRHVDLKA